MVRELCKYRFRAAFDVWALWCGGAPFGRFPSRLRRRGAHLGGGGAAVDKLPRGERTGRGGLLCEGASAFAFALPHPALGASPISGRERGRRQAAAGRAHGASPISRRGRGRRQADAGRTHGATPISERGRGGRQAVAGRTHGQGRGWSGALPSLRTVIRHTSGMARHCARGRPPLPSPSPTLRSAARDTVAQRRGLFSGAARTLPGSGRRANDILYIRVRRREGENVLHRAASNDVDNFSVDNPLWITAAAGGRLLRGGARKAVRGKCERGYENANTDGAGAEVFAGDGCSQGASFAPGLRFHGANRVDVYIIIHVRACCCGECALNPPPSQFTPRRRPPLAPTQRHALPEHFRSPTQPRRTPAGCAMHSPPTAQPFPRSATLPLLPFRFGHKKTAPHSACAMPNVSVDRRCGRSFGLVSRALFAAVAGRWRVGVGLRPQPWALRSRRCGRVLRA